MLPRTPAPTQRDRLIAAMTQVAAAQGYRETTVAQVVSLAGVSRATFYENFTDKESCFHAAHREMARRLRSFLRTWASERGRSPQALRVALSSLLEEVRRDPASARILLVESLAAGPALRVEREELMRAVGASVGELLAQQGVRRLEVPTAALVGGLIAIVSARVRRNEAEALPALLDDLLTWLESYAAPADGSRRSEQQWAALGREYQEIQKAAGGLPAASVDPNVRRKLPRGRSRLPVGVSAEEHRRRIVEAIAETTRRKGYAATTVTDIVASAGISRDVFYANFAGKHDAFMTAQTAALQGSMAACTSAFFLPGRWPERVWSGGHAFFAYAMSVPDLTHLEVIEPYAAGAPAIQRVYDTQMAFTIFLEDGYRQTPSAEAMPRLCSEAIAGAMFELIYRHVSTGRTERLLEVLPLAAHTIYAPFVGSARAGDLVEEQMELARQQRA